MAGHHLAVNLAGKVWSQLAATSLYGDGGRGGEQLSMYSLEGAALHGFITELRASCCRSRMLDRWCMRRMRSRGDGCAEVPVE